MNVVLVSGGVDSFCAAELYPEAVHLFIAGGTKYDDLEEHAVKKLFKNPVIVKVNGLPMHKPTNPDSTGWATGNFIPARNLMYATLALRYGDNIIMAGLKDEKCADKSPAAFRLMSFVLSEMSQKTIAVRSPFWKKTKTDAIDQYLSLGGDVERLKQTVSCYEPNGIEPCNNCQACFRRAVALKSCGIDVPKPEEEITERFNRNKRAFQKSRILVAEAAFKIWDQEA